MSVVRVFDILIVCFVDRYIARVSVFDPELIYELVLHVLGEAGNEEFRVLIELYHALLVK